MMTMTCKKEHLSKNKNYCTSLHLRRPIGSLDASNMVAVSFIFCYCQETMYVLLKSTIASHILA